MSALLGRVLCAIGLHARHRYADRWDTWATYTCRRPRCDWATLGW